MSLPSIDMPDWILAIAKLVGGDNQRIVLLGKHPLAKIYLKKRLSSSLKFTLIEERSEFYNEFRKLDGVCLLLVFGDGGFDFLKHNAADFRSKLLGIPIIEVYDNGNMLYDGTQEQFQIFNSPVRIYDDYASHQLCFEMERVLLEFHPTLREKIKIAR